MEEKVNIWNSLKFGESGNSSFDKIRDKLDEIGNDLCDKTNGILTKDISNAGDYVNFCFTFTAKAVALGNYGIKVFSIAYDSEKAKYTIWNHKGDDGISFENIEELESKIEEAMTDKVNQSIQQLYKQAKDNLNE